MINTKTFCRFLIFFIIMFSLSNSDAGMVSEAYEKSKLVKKGMSIEETERILSRHNGSHWYQVSGIDHLWWWYSDGSRLNLIFRKAPYKQGMPSKLEEIVIEKEWYQIN